MPTLTPAGFGSTFSLAAFRQWEKVIHEAINAFPSPVYVTPNKPRLDIVCARIREAARGYWTHNYTSYINRIEFFERWPLITLTPISLDRIVLGSKEHFTENSALVAATATAQAANNITFDCTSLDQLQHFLALANSSCFRSQPIKLVSLTLPCTNFLLNGTYQLTYPNTFVDVLGPNEAIIL